MNCPKCGSEKMRYMSHPSRYECWDCNDVFTEREASLTAQCLELEADRDVLTTEVEQLREALGEYAKRDSWCPHRVSRISAFPVWEWVYDMAEPWTVACDALAEPRT